MDKPLRPLANRFCGCSVWALAPFFVVFGALLFASLFPLAKRKSGWGICGSSCLVVFCGFCVLFYSICLLKMDMLCPCTNVFPTAYAHVRTEPLARHRPYSRKKKSCEETWWRSCIFQSFGVTLRSHWQCFGFPQDFVCNCVHRLERSLHSMVSVLRRLHCSLTVRP